MPELPEVETACRMMRHALAGKRITRLEVSADPIFFSGLAPQAIEEALRCRCVRELDRHGKFKNEASSGATVEQQRRVDQLAAAVSVKGWYCAEPGALSPKKYRFVELLLNF